MKILHQRFALIRLICLVMTSLATGSLAALAAEGKLDLSQDQATDLDQGVTSPGTLKVGMEANYSPYNWSQADDQGGAVPISNSPGEYANGYDVQVAKNLADQLGLKLEIQKLEWDGLAPALQSGMIDAIIAGMSPTPDRLKQLDFTDAYYQASMVVVVAKDGPYGQAKSLDDFKDAKITAQLNTFHVDLIEQLKGAQAQVPMDSFSTMTSALISHRVDGFISDIAGAMGIVAANQDLTYIEFPEGQGFDLDPSVSTIAVGLRKGSPLKPILNQALGNISPDQQDQIMKDMVQLKEGGQATGFWGQVASIWNQYGSQFIRGAMNTLIIALVSTILGCILGLLIAIYRTIPVSREDNGWTFFLYKLFDFVILAYIEIFRGTPMMVQAMLIYYGSKLFFNIDMSSMFAAFLIVSINTGAYLAEVMRGGITSVDKGQSEAAKAIGMNHLQTMTNVVLPQAIKTTLPAIANEFVINIKDTSVLNVIAVTELFFTTRSVAGSTYLTFQTFLITSLIYFVLTFTTTRIIRLFEYKMNGKDNYTIHHSSTTPASLQKGA